MNDPKQAMETKRRSNRHGNASRGDNDQVEWAREIL